MFYDTTVEILDNRTSPPVETVRGDVQPHVKKYRYEDGYELETTKRLFCDRVSSINNDSYIRIGTDLYKVLEMKEWSDHLELYLYKCKV